MEVYQVGVAKSLLRGNYVHSGINLLVVFPTTLRSV